MLKKLKLASFAAVLALGGFAANAATITSVNAPLAYADIDFTKTTTIQTNGPATFTSAPDAISIKTGSVLNQWRSPFGDGDITTPYFNVAAGNTATLALDSAQTILSFLWGSVDTHNTVKLYLTGSAAPFLTLLSSSLAPAPVPGDSGGASFVTVSDVLIDRVEFVSGGTSFEIASIAAVPLPAGVLLLLTAVGGFGVARRLARPEPRCSTPLL